MMQKLKTVLSRPRVRAGVAATVAVAAVVAAAVVGVHVGRSGGPPVVAGTEVQRLPEAAGPVLPNTTGRSTATPVVEPTAQWVSIPAQQAASGIAPGAPMQVTRVDGSVITCTLGPAVYQLATDRAGFLTAGGCAGRASVGGVDLGEVTDVVDSYGEYGKSLPTSIATTAEDAAVLWTPLARGHNTIAGHRVVGVMPEILVTQLPAGTPICQAGAATGVTCGGFKASQFFLVSDGSARNPGDAGAPMFVVGADGNAQVVATIASDGGVGSVADRAAHRLGIAALP